MEARNQTQPSYPGILTRIYRGFDAVATWLSQLSWWKFFLFAALTLIAGAILQNELFSGWKDEEVTRSERRAAQKTQPSVVIDDSGIHINPHKPGELAAPPASPAAPAAPEAPQAPGVADTPAKVRTAPGEVHIGLPPQIGEELSAAISQAVDDAAEQKTRSYHKQASTWFFSFVWLLVLAMFGTKALVGGKKRAEAATQFATAAAERESMQRQLSEAKMRMMQSQVEPHFLFNTLASVEHLIETNPPRASAMQRSLIQYLRAVLPQMRESNLSTRLGTELDMVAAYLKLLKMRMEERLTVDIQVPAELRDACFPPMMLQSLVENAIKHGLECKPEGGRLTVLADVAGDKLRVTVADDGVGFGVVPSTGTGLGLTNIRERLKLLHGAAGKFHVAPNNPSGVIATIEIPYQRASDA